MITTILKLDVGGQLFSTTLGTLTREPSSKLTKLAYDKWLSPASTASSASGPSPTAPTIFFDRDPSHFRYVLNFLRDGDTAILPSPACSQNAPVLIELLREAEFYELKTLQLKICSLLGGRHCSNASINCCASEQSSGRIKRICASDSNTNGSAQSQNHDAEWAPKSGDQIEWTEEGFDEFWRALMEKITERGYVDWLQCHHCDNDYQVRLPELPDVLCGWRNVKNFLLDMKGKVDSYVNEKCVYVMWKNVYCGKDGYLDSVVFIMHVPLSNLKPCCCVK